MNCGPGPPVSFMSGYAYPVTEGGELAPDDLFLEKPFAALESSELVRSDARHDRPSADF